MGAQKENEKSPDTRLKVMEYCALNYRDFKIAIIKKLYEIQENSERQFNELRNKINKQKGVL